MIETIDNAAQLIVTGLCTVTAIGGGVKYHRREWVLTGLFSGVFFLGVLYWFLYFIFYSNTPTYSGIPYMSWYASYIFLSLLLVEVKGEGGKLGFRRFWPVLLFTGGMGVYFMRYGAYANNVITAVLMSFLICGSLDGVLRQKEIGKWRVCASALLFCLLEYAMWISSCIWSGDTPRNPYFWFDFLLTADFLLIILSVRKEVSDELY